MTRQFHDHQLDKNALDQIFLEARTYNGWLDKEVSDDQLRQIWDLLKMGPTSANQQPVRIVWVKSAEAKAKLVECVGDGNKDKVGKAPVTALIAYDLDFHEELPWLFPHTDAKSWFEGNEAMRKDHGFRNSSLQGAYLILAARAIGLDTGPMSGFDAEAVEKAFFSDNPRHKINFICSIGYGDPDSIFERNPRPDFENFTKIV